MSMERVINELNECIEHIRENEFNKIPFWGNCQSAMMDALAILKEQQQKKEELLKQFDKEIECAEQARIGSACEGENAWVEHYACQKSNYEHAKSIVENTL